LSLLVPVMLVAGRVMLDMKSFGHFCYKPPARSTYPSIVRLTMKLIVAQ
jgi:hypothetical protein